MSISRISEIEELQKERVTDSKIVITSDHTLIHAGRGYSVSGIFTSVANGATVNYAFKTPTVASGKIVHLKFKEIQSIGNKTRVDFYEAPTNAPTSGSDVAQINRRRLGTPPVSNMQAFKSGMTLNLSGATLLESEQLATAVLRSLDLEYVLKQDTWYIRTFTNSSGSSVDISFFEFWYEEDNG
jgi:hypothetical protein